MKKFTKSLFASLAFLTLGLTSCNEVIEKDESFEANNKCVLSVTFETNYEECLIGDTVNLNPVIKFKDDVEIENITKIWSSSRRSVATVNEEGIVDVIGSGTTYISLIAGYQMAKCTIYVPDTSTTEEVDPENPNPDPVDPDALVITLSTYSRTMDVNGSFSLTATANKEISNVAFAVSDGSILQITESSKFACVIKALAVGESEVYATSGDIQVSCHITVKDPDTPEEEDDDKEYTVYFYIDYNNVDPNDATGTKLLVKPFKWYYDRPLSESGKVPTVSNSQAMDPAFPYFIGWSTHPVIDTKDYLWDMANNTIEDIPIVSYTVILYGQWLDVPVLAN